ncbi:uncharacterized protein LOC132048131 [Lycium ferocissimum]|uniref:uncharacterized protein LOC132048131 n=1 Tax=Lycium ferocissimum TaxID=112874 RepID=UPI0028168188|nr:uncharacterized protein LOC132048131 [Lycium ferocissimum]
MANSISINSDNNDKPIWTISHTGKFSIGSAWKNLRQEKPHNQLYSRLWHTNIPFKMSFLTWRVVHNRLSTDQSVARLGIPMDPKCYCPLGISTNNTNLKFTLLNWWNHKTKNPFCALIIKIIPALTCWEIWRLRCCNKFEAERYSLYRSIANILFSILQVLKNKFGNARFGNSWNTICQACEAISIRNQPYKSNGSGPTQQCQAQ